MSKKSTTITVPLQPLLTRLVSLESLPIALPSPVEISVVCERQIRFKFSTVELEDHGFTVQQLTRSIAEIVGVNLESGRGLHVMRSTGGLVATALAGYCDRVITTYLAEHRRVDNLLDRDEAEWQRLCTRLQALARRMLRYYDLSTSLAADFAQQTCECILNHPFPFDVAFDAWSAVILKNMIRWSVYRSHDALDQNWAVFSLDQPIPSARANPNGHEMSMLHDLLRDPIPDLIFERRETQAWLLAAIEQLPSLEQKQVVIYGFLYGLADTEIADRLGRTRQAVYNLRHRALRELRRIVMIIN